MLWGGGGGKGVMGGYMGWGKLKSMIRCCIPLWEQPKEEDKARKQNNNIKKRYCIALIVVMCSIEMP